MFLLLALVCSRQGRLRVAGCPALPERTVLWVRLRRKHSDLPANGPTPRRLLHIYPWYAYDTMMHAVKDAESRMLFAGQERPSRRSARRARQDRSPTPQARPNPLIRPECRGKVRRVVRGHSLVDRVCGRLKSLHPSSRQAPRHVQSAAPDATLALMVRARGVVLHCSCVST